MERYENNLVNQPEGETQIEVVESMEEVEQPEKNLSKEDLEKIIKEIKEAYKQAVEGMLEDGDPLKEKILDYFVNRKEVDNEYNYILSNLADEDKIQYAENIKNSLNDQPAFINKMERYFSVQDIYKREKELAEKPRIATEEEYEIGAYSDLIEPQVRDAVFLVNEKGYKTFQSGFREKDPTNQYIDVYNANVEIPENLKEILTSYGVEVQVENLDDRTTVTLSPKDPSKTIRQETWKKIWDEFSEGLPDADPKLVDNLKEPSLHRDFRKVQDLRRQIQEA